MAVNAELQQTVSLFMQSAAMFYREAKPSPAASRIVFSFWECVVPGETEEPWIHEVFPDGAAVLLYYRNRKINAEQLLVAGLVHESRKVPVYGGDVYWGMRISPAARRSILGAEADLKQAMPMHLLPALAEYAPDLRTRLNECEDFASAIEAFEDFTGKLQHISVDAKIAAAVGFIENCEAQTRVGEIAAEIGLSTRQFERRFLRASGLTPKQYLRVRRLRFAAVDLVVNESSNWATRAAEFGYADQAHLAHEFNSVTNRSPSSFAEKISRIEHGALVK